MDQHRLSRSPRHRTALVTTCALIGFWSATGQAASASVSPHGAEMRASQANTSSAGAPTTGASDRSKVTPARNGTHAASGHQTSGTAGTAGDVNNPQPPSHADQQPGGANGDQCTGSSKAVYCSTRDGSPSLNGSGGGQAVGKPCAGCVGKADNKNPPGQETVDPAGTFPDNGYECDHNQGIGRTNPAHTGCVNSPPPVVCDSTVDDCSPVPPTACVPTEANHFCSDVLGVKHTKTPRVLAEREVGTPRALPFTGVNASLALLLGFLAVAAGGALLIAARRVPRG